MATLQERSALVAQLRDRGRIALAATLTDVLLEPDNTGDAPGVRKARRIKQRWALGALGNIEASTTRVLIMVAAKAPDAQISSGGELDDAELANLVGQAVDAIAGVELYKPDETLPV